MLQKIKTNWLYISFFSLYFLIGINIYKDYGISFDEVYDRTIGQVNAVYIVGLIDEDFSEKLRTENGIPKLHEFNDKDHGATFDIVTLIPEIVFQIRDKQQIYYMRHLLNFLFYFISAIFVFLVSNNVLKNKNWALFSVLLFVLMPKFFAESFYNSKDITFLSAFIIAAYYSNKLITKQNLSTILIASFAIAFASTIRLMGFILPAITACFMLLESFINHRENIKRTFFWIILFWFSTFSFLYLMWPLIWENTFDNLAITFLNMSKYPWNHQVYYMGKLTLAAQLPSHYLIVLFLISTPIPYTIIFLIGIAISAYKWFQNPKRIFEKNHLSLLFYFSLFAFPLFYIIESNAVVYSGWRHVYFIYFGFVIITTYSAVQIKNMLTKKFNSKGLIACYAIAVFMFGSIAVRLAKMHPFQNIYFNCLVPKNGPFEYDYWATSYANGLRYVLRNNPDKTIKIYFYGSHFAQYILTKSERNRIVMVENFEKADFYFSNYLVGRNYYIPHNNYKKYYELMIDGNQILCVFENTKRNTSSAISQENSK